MTEPNNSIEVSNYDVTTIVIGGLKDLNLIFKAIESCFDNNDSVEELISVRNEFNIRSEKSRLRIESAVKQAFLQFKNQDHKNLIQCVFQSDAPLAEKQLVLFWQFVLNNRLFREISSCVFMKMYFSGRSYISKDDVIAYLKDLFNNNDNQNVSWSESTINILAGKYLTLMTKLNFLEGTRTKSFRHIKTSTEALVFFLYIAKIHGPEISNILLNDMLNFSFIAHEDFLDRLKKLSLKGLIKMNYNGVALNVELLHSYREICDVLYERP